MGISNNPRDWQAVNPGAAELNTVTPAETSRPAAVVAGGDDQPIIVGDPFLLGPVGISVDPFITGFPWRSATLGPNVADGVLFINNNNSIFDARIRNLPPEGSTVLLEFAAPTDNQILTFFTGGGIVNLDPGERAAEHVINAGIAANAPIYELTLFSVIGSTIDASQVLFKDRFLIRQVEPSVGGANDAEAFGEQVGGAGPSFNEDTPVSAGVQGGFLLNAGLSFPDINVNRGIQVAGAVLTIRHNIAELGVPDTEIRGDLNPNAPKFAAGVTEYQPSEIQPTVAAYDPEGAGLPASGTGVVWNMDVTAIVNEILDSDDWGYGNRLNFVWNTLDAIGTDSYFFDGLDVFTSQLTITL